MYTKEAELVNEEYLTDGNTYNLKRGGFGGFDYINKDGRNIYPNHKEIVKKAFLDKGIELIKQIRLMKEQDYYQNPDKCKACNKDLPYPKPENRKNYCNHSCAAKITNKTRILKKNLGR